MLYKQKVIHTFTKFNAMGNFLRTPLYKLTIFTKNKSKTIADIQKSSIFAR